MNSHPAQKPISAKLTFAKRIHIQELIAKHCKNITWTSGNNVNKTDFRSIRRPMIMTFDPISMSIQISVKGLFHNSEGKFRRAEIKSPKDLLVAIKRISDAQAKIQARFKKPVPLTARERRELKREKAKKQTVIFNEV